MQLSKDKIEILKTILFALIFLVFQNLVGYYAWAQTPHGSEGLPKVQALEHTKEKLVDQEQKQRRVLAAVYELNKKMQKLEHERGRFSREQQEVELGIKSLQTKIEDLSKKASAQKALLSERLRAIYKFGEGNVANLIFSSLSASSLERNLRILGIVANRDLDLIHEYKENLKGISKRKEKLANRLTHLNKIEAKIAQKEEQLQAEQKTKSKILDGIKRTQLFAISEIQKLRSSAKSNSNFSDDSGALDLLYRESFAEQKGKLPSPVLGPVIQKYGVQKVQDRHYTISSKGVVIAAPVGASIKAVFSGRVAFVGSLPSFGETLILDHGDHYYTVYGNAEKAKVQVGDEVKQSAVIASTGVGLKKYEGIYFEVRHFSEPNDPLKWVKGIN